MSKSLAERYAQILSEDPTSTVFVELAKALLAQGEWEQAIEVCRQGLEHHPQSVIARVLWGRALIHLGKPAPAMEQFDLAVNIDRDNPHAYNLISEVLLQKGLYRSALPILRKAVALQPHDARVQGWLEQTRQALEGGPAPAFEATDALVPKDPDAPDQEASEAEDADAPAPGAAEAGEEEAAAGLATEKVPVLGEEPTTDGAAPPHADIPQLFPVDGPGAPTGARPEEDPQDAVTPAGGTEPVRKARKSGVLSAAWEVGPQDVRPREPSNPFDEDERTVVEPGTQAAAGDAGLLGELSDPGLDEGDASVDGGARAESDGDDGGARAASDGGLLGDLPALELPSAGPAADASPAAASGPGVEHIPAGVGSSGVLLEELPLPDAAPSAGGPQAGSAKVRLKVGPSAKKSSESIASDYEKELHRKLAVQRAASRARTRRIIGGAAALAALIVVGAGVWAYSSTRDGFGGKDLRGALTEAGRALGADTHASIQRSLTSLETATRMDRNSTEAWGLTAFAHALLAADHDGGPEAVAAARAALDRPGVREAHPSIGLVTEWLLKEGREQELAGDAVLASSARDAEVQALAGRILLASGRSEAALERFQLALEIEPTHGRTLLALAAYFREAGDDAQALAMYERVQGPHPEKVIGEIEIGLLSDALPDGALQALEALPEQELRTPEYRSRALLASAQVLSLEGRHEEALARVVQAEALEPFPLRTLLVKSAVERAAGRTTRAQASAEAALKLDADSDAAKEALGRALLARGKPRELLEALPADADNRTVSLMRGLARARLEDWRSARTEFARTALEGRFPPEAVVGLAMVDANGGRPEKAQESLERLLVSDARVPDSIRVALGQVYWQRGLLDRAKAQFEDAAARPRDAEGNLQLGRLLLEQEHYTEALEPLKRALERNAGSEQARAAYTQALLGLGKTEEAEAQLSSWLEADGDSALAHYWSARAALLQGDGKRAAVSARRATLLDRSWAEAVRVQSVAQSMAGSGNAAFTTLQRANRMDSKDAETFCEIGWTFLRRGNAKNAEAAFEAALKNDSLAVCARAGQVELNPRGYRTQTADIERLAQAAGSVWSQAQWQIALSQVHLVNRKNKEALETAQKAATLVPGSARAHAAVARAAEASRKTDEAKAAWEKALSLDPDNGAYHLAQATLLARQRDTLEDALNAYRAYLRLPGEDAEIKRVRRLLPQLERRVASR